MKTKLLPLLLVAFVSYTTPSYSQWSAPLNISPGTTAVGTNENAGQCLVKVGDTLRITYSDRSTAMAKIMYNQSPDMGNTWGTPVQLFSSLNCGFTAIASCGSSVHIVWMDSLGSDRASFYKRSLDGGATWDSTICLDSVTKFWPGIACSDSLVIATLNKDLSGNTEVFIKRSLNNGSTWLPEQQVSNAPNRSEDPAINILGNDVHLSWNDKRSDTMNIYYCHSADQGATWGTETALTHVDSYTSMVCLDSNNVDVPHGVRDSASFDVWLAESGDTGSVFLPNQNLTNTHTTAELYPFMVRDGLKMHVVYIGPGGANYLHSTDGGLTWDTPVFLSASGQPFIAYTGCILHVMFTNAGHINYMRNPTGNGICTVTGGPDIPSTNSGLAVYPNPVSDEVNIELLNTENKISELSILNTLGEVEMVQRIGDNVRNATLSVKSLSAGIYFVKVQTNEGIITGRIIKE